MSLFPVYKCIHASYNSFFIKFKLINHTYIYIYIYTVVTYMFMDDNNRTYAMYYLEAFRRKHHINIIN